MTLTPYQTQLYQDVERVLHSRHSYGPNPWNPQPWIQRSAFQLPQLEKPAQVRDQRVWGRLVPELDGITLLTLSHTHDDMVMHRDVYDRCLKIASLEDYLQEVCQTLHDRWEDFLKRQTSLIKSPSSSDQRISFLYPPGHAPLKRHTHAFFEDMIHALSFHGTPEQRRDWLRVHLEENWVKMAMTALEKGDPRLILLSMGVIGPEPHHKAHQWQETIRHFPGAKQQFKSFGHSPYHSDLYARSLMDGQWQAYQQVVYQWAQSPSGLPPSQHLFDLAWIAPSKVLSPPLLTTTLPDRLLFHAGLYLWSHWPWNPETPALNRAHLDDWSKQHSHLKLNPSTLPLFWKGYVKLTPERDARSAVEALLARPQRFNHHTLTWNGQISWGISPSFFVRHRPDDFSQPIESLHHQKDLNFLWPVFVNDVRYNFRHNTTHSRHFLLPNPGTAPIPLPVESHPSTPPSPWWAWLDYFFIEHAQHPRQHFKTLTPDLPIPVFILLKDYPHLEQWRTKYLQWMHDQAQSLLSNLSPRHPPEERSLLEYTQKRLKSLLDQRLLERVLAPDSSPTGHTEPPPIGMKKRL